MTMTTPQNKRLKLNLDQAGFLGFRRMGSGGGGGGLPCLHNFASLKAVTVRLGGEIVHPKIFPLRSVTRSDNVLLCNDIMIAKWRPSWIFGFLQDFRKVPKIEEHYYGLKT